MHYHVINKDRRWLTGQKQKRKAKMFQGSFQYKTKYNTIWFSQEN